MLFYLSRPNSSVLVILLNVITLGSDIVSNIHRVITITDDLYSVSVTQNTVASIELNHKPKFLDKFRLFFRQRFF